jgi:Bifunctional DNA primase/polymerase, N-terminal/Primase C terminal 1 (PriCT-1)
VEVYQNPANTENLSQEHRRTTQLKAALAYARRGKPVFPCENKEPRIANGHLKATTDPRQIHMWWKRWPHAQIGIPMGERAGVFALDLDSGNPEKDTTRAEMIVEGLPETRTHRTGSGGRHYILNYPGEADMEIRNSVSKLAEGLDVRGEGGYIIVPPSSSALGAYEVLDASPPADPPEWLLEALREPERASGEKVRSITTAASVTVEGPPIPDGTRDDALTSIAGRLHDGSRGLDGLAADLLEINAARCEPPLPEAQVLKIARSIHRREPCGGAGATPEVLEALRDVEADLYRRDAEGDFKGMGGKSERDAIVAAIKIGRRHGGRLIPGGVRISVSVRDWALEAAVSKRSMLDYWKKGERKPGVITRLKRRGMVRSDNGRRHGGNSGAIVLVGRAEFHHSPIQVGVGGSGETLRAPRLRWSAPRFDRVGDEYVRTTVKRLGKGCGATVDHLEAAGGTMSEKELAAALGMKRARDLHRKAPDGQPDGYLDRLEAAGVVECANGTVTLADDYLQAIDRERRLTGEIDREEVSGVLGDDGSPEVPVVKGADTLQREKHRRERDEYHDRRQNPPTPHLANIGVDGFTPELEPVPEVDEGLALALQAFLRRNPQRKDEKPSWLSSAMWAEGYTSGKAPPLAVEVALADLAGGVATAGVA